MLALDGSLNQIYDSASCLGVITVTSLHKRTLSITECHYFISILCLPAGK